LEFLGIAGVLGGVLASLELLDEELSEHDPPIPADAARHVSMVGITTAMSGLERHS